MNITIFLLLILIVVISSQTARHFISSLIDANMALLMIVGIIFLIVVLIVLSLLLIYEIKEKPDVLVILGMFPFSFIAVRICLRLTPKFNSWPNTRELIYSIIITIGIAVICYFYL